MSAGSSSNLTATEIGLAPSDRAEVTAYQVEPKRAEAGLVVVQEIFGVNRHIKALADVLAGCGYGVVAPRLFDRIEKNVELGYGRDDVERGKRLRAKFSDVTALMDVQAAIDAASRFGAVAVVGYCWGGRLAWLASARCSGLKAAVCYYPGGIGGLTEETPRVPVLLHFGERDESIPLDEVKLLEARHPKLLIHRYDAGHGFSCEARSSFNAASHELALTRTRHFLLENVG
jgi:carboxymethylenebutenolidase